MSTLDIARVRADFPALAQDVHPGKPLVYLDSAATALKPQIVIDAVHSAYAKDVANVHRGVHALSQRATARYEGGRDIVQEFLGAAKREEIIFTRGTSESINLVAHTLGLSTLKPGDEILLTELEHHSNIVPWQLVARMTGAKVVVAPIDEHGEVSLAAFRAQLSERTKFVAFAHVSNALGTILPVEDFARAAKEVGAYVLVDGAQGAAHGPVEVQALAAVGVDFYALSGHKLYGPSGIGVLWGREALLEEMPPYQGGGDMIDRVTFAETTWANLPYKFEAGTPNIAGAIGLGAALAYLGELGWDAVAAHEADVFAYGVESLAKRERVRMMGSASARTSVLPFTIEGAHPSDVASFLDAAGVAIRTGHHCAQPVMDHFGVVGTARASLGVYNSREDIDRLVAALDKTLTIL